MSSLVLRWLNEDLRLHRQVEVLERDLSNGYVIAEVLHLKGMEPQLEGYKDSSSTAAKIHNMELLGERLEALGLPFPVSTRRSIMMENRAAVLQFILQLKDFLRPRPKSRSNATPRRGEGSTQPEKISATVQSRAPPHDLEDRFVVETIKKYHPTEVRFDKDIDMAVHLRKFQQLQWKAENDLNDIHDQAKADNNANSAAGYAAARAHLQAKAKFMRDWDKEHLDNWKYTQRTHLAIERDDLRLELALQERQRIFAEDKLAASQQDAAAGVVEFEKNMNRLGLSSVGTDQSLRAIPASDADALAHFRGLEKRVEDLNFRPSNNVKMMKELRKRRKAQLAAEKDRRMRRQKALVDQKKPGNSNLQSIEVLDTEDVQNGDLDSNQISVNGETDELAESESTTKPTVGTREQYMDERQAGLVAHYEHLRETGSLRRKEDMKVLEALHLESRKKQRLRSWAVCSDAVEGLISIAMMIVFSSEGDVLDIQALKKKLFLQATPTQPTLSEQGGLEFHYGLDALVSNYLSFSEVWADFSIQSPLATYDPKPEIETLAANCTDPNSSLDTTWCRPLSFVVISMRTEDESGLNLARQVAKDHQLAFVQLDQVMEECIKMSYDPLKIGDQLATLSDRERELGAFGPKISALRQKSAILPEAMVTEIMAKVVLLCRREYADVSTNIGGCMLHNFPRTTDEAKALEKAILADIPSAEVDTNGLPQDLTASEVVGEPPESAFISAWDCIILVSADQSQVEPPSKGSESTAGRDEMRPSASKSTLAEAQKKFAAEEEQRVRTEEQRANLENYWSQTTRILRVDRTGLHRDVVLETIHLCIDYFTQTPHTGLPAVIQCQEGSFPEELKPARDRRRESMGLVNRVMWMRRSKEINLADDALLELVRMLDKMDATLSRKLREPMARIQSVLQAISTLAITTEQDLENELQSDGAASFQSVLEQALARLKGMDASDHRERVLTEVEVALGDMADFNRVAGNDFVNTLGRDPLPDVVGAVDVVYQSLPPICFCLMAYTVEKLQILSERLYGSIPFLSENFQDAGKKVILSSAVAREAMSAATALGDDAAGGGQFAQLAGEEILSILGQIASEYTFHLADDSPMQQYTLCETNVVTQEITKLLQRMALLCRFADRLRQTTEQLYARDVNRLQQIVQADIQVKDKAIQRVMADIRSDGIADWPVTELMLEPVADIAVRLPRAQRQNFLSIEQLGALVRACRNWEVADPIAAGIRGGMGIASDVFVALVLEVAALEKLPTRWRDSVSIAAATLQQCSARGVVSWRKFVWALLCIQFIGIPSFESILDCLDQARKLPSIKRQLQAALQSEHHNAVVSANDFQQMTLWFEQRSEVRGSHEAAKLKSLVFQLFATGTDCEDPHVELLPMLLFWCVHPSCSFHVRRELEDFLPRYSRGLFRAFHLLQKCATDCTAPPCISSFLSVTSTSFDAQELSDLLISGSFAQFSLVCPPSIHQFFLLQNPLQALTN